MVSFTANWHLDWGEMFRLAVSFFSYLNRPCYVACLTRSLNTYRKQFYDSHMYSRALDTLELIMLKQHVLFVPQFSFSSSDYLHALIGVCT